MHRRKIAMGARFVRTATADDKTAILNVVLLAFAADPFARWVSPDPSKYVSFSPEFAGAFGGKGFAHNSVDVIDDGTGPLGVGMWLPPGVEPDGERMEAIIGEHAPEHVLGESEESSSR